MNSASKYLLALRCLFPMSNSALRQLPRVDDLAGALPAEFSHARRVQAARQVLATLRECWKTNPPATEGTAEEGAQQQVLASCVAEACKYLREAGAPFPARVLNATGIVVHTGLGRSRLSAAAVEAVALAARDGGALEVDVESGARGRRDTALARVLCEITGAEDATIVNNGAGATLLALAALCGGGEVACSRGELVEIGGGFRMPDVMAQSGCALREVGTTNKTRLSDYREVLAGNERARGILKVHPSNFRIAGFTEEVSIEELAILGRELGLPIVDDLGSGAMFDLGPWGLSGEPTVPSHVAAGADAIIFSGDKLLGGPQCGIICGESAAIEKIRRHPLARALRADKMTLAALAATLEAYRDADNRFAQARREIPTLAALCEEEGEVKKRAQKLQRWLAQSQARGAGLAAAGPRWRMEVRASRAQAGAGSLPTRDLPSWSLVLIPPGAPASAGAPEAAGTVGGEVGGTVGEAARRLRRGGLWGRVESGALWLDARTLRDGDVDEVVRAVSAFFTSLSLERERKNLEARGNT